MLERWSFSFTLSEKRNIFSTFQQIVILLFPNVTDHIPVHVVDRIWAGAEENKLIIWQDESNPSIPQTFLQDFMKRGQVLQSQEIHHTWQHSAQGKWVVDHSVVFTSWRSPWMKKVKSTLGFGSYWWCLCWPRHLYEEPFSRWIKQELWYFTQSCQAYFARTRNVFQDELSKSQC